ncbi:GntR family transcriptional regulator [Sphingobium aquiterrae]|jgi:GntR family carbon starvation induced transcriptional regulator
MTMTSVEYDIFALEASCLHGNSAQGGAKTAVEAAYSMLRRHLINGRYPQGSRLKLDYLKSAYGVSGSTVREALTRLIGDHLVIFEGQKGFSVAPMSLADLDDLTIARTTLDCAAIRESIALGDDEWEARLIAAFHRLTRAEERLVVDPSGAFDDWEQRNKAFHEALLAASTSKWLERLRDILFHNTERYRRLSATQGPPPTSVHAEHSEIFEAALARDADRAVKALEEHLQRARKVIGDNRLLLG